MPSQKSLIIAISLGIAGVLAVSLFIINSFIPIKLVKEPISIKLSSNSIESQSNNDDLTKDDWTMPVATNSARPLFLVLINPGEFQTSENTQVQVNGQTTGDAKVRINERSVNVTSDGSFNAVATLKPGLNQIIVTAVSPTGEEKMQIAEVLTASGDLASQIKVTTTEGILTDIEGTTLKIKTSAGLESSFSFDKITRFYRKYGEEIAFDKISTGDTLTISGVNDQALAIRDLSNVTHIADLAGVVTKFENKIVTLNSNLTVDVSKLAVNVAMYPPNTKVWVTGLLDPRSGKVTGLTEISIISN